MRNRTARSHRFTPFAFVMAIGLSGCAQDDAAAPAGAVPRYELGEPEVVSGDFGSVNDIRVRPDGSLLVADRTGGELVLVDLDLGTRTVVGGRGEGPGEYQAPSGIWPLPGDSTLLLDMANNRLTVLTPDLSFGATRPMLEVDPEGGVLMLNPRAIDGSGRMYTTNGFSMSLVSTGAGGGSDSIPVVRATLDDLTPDTVARLAPRSTARVQMRSNQGNRIVTTQRTPYSSSDSWGVAPDGSVAVARAADYRLEWISSDGSVRSGAPVAWDAVPVGKAEKEAWVREQSSRSVQTATFVRGGGGGVSPGSGIGGAAARSMTFGAASDDVDDYEWPETLPAFTGGILIDPEGRAWLRRHQPVGAPWLYDIFTPDAEHAGVVEIAGETTVIGFGDGVVYATFRDEVDLVYIERYRLPEMKASPTPH